jgi:hypothetical protein
MQKYNFNILLPLNNDNNQQSSAGKKTTSSVINSEKPLSRIEKYKCETIIYLCYMLILQEAEVAEKLEEAV